MKEDENSSNLAILNFKIKIKMVIL